MRQWVICLGIVAVLAAGCSDDDGGGWADLDSISTTSSVPATTTTRIPVGEVFCPEGIEPIGVADVDGDGVEEALIVSRGADGPLLLICGELGGRPLELDDGVWYVAVTDVEPDGTDEIFVGAASVGDGPDQIEAQFFWLDPRGAELALHTDDFAGVWLGRTQGIGCVDRNDDGARELVAFFNDGGPDVVTWERETARARPFEVAADPASLEFVRGTDDAAIALLSEFSCGDDVVEPVRLAPTASLCESDPFARLVDVDLDGADDRVMQAFRETDFWTGPSLVVCTAAGEVDEALVGGMGEIFAVSKGTGDRPTIWAGGTTVSAAILEPYVWLDGWIVPIETTEGPLVLSDGFVSEVDLDRYGCGDLDGNGISELILLEGDRGDGEITWTRRSWETVGAVATQVTTETGTLPVGIDEEIDTSVYDGLVPPAEDCLFGDLID